MSIRDHFPTVPSRTQLFTTALGSECPARGKWHRPATGPPPTSRSLLRRHQMQRPARDAAGLWSPPPLSLHNRQHAAMSQIGRWKLGPKHKLARKHTLWQTNSSCSSDKLSDSIMQAFSQGMQTSSTPRGCLHLLRVHGPEGGQLPVRPTPLCPTGQQGCQGAGGCRCKAQLLQHLLDWGSGASCRDVGGRGKKGEGW